MEHWQEQDGKLVMEKTFANFSEAFSFLTRVALLAEKKNHHPSIENTYNKVRLTLCTHDAGNTITDKDRQLAAMIEDVL